MNNSQISIPNYLSILRTEHLYDKEMDKLLSVHLETILGLENCSLADALSQQFSWDRENVLQRNSSLLDIAAELCRDYSQTLSKLLKDMMEQKFTGWKYALGLIKFILWSDPELKGLLRSKNSDFIPLGYVFIKNIFPFPETTTELFSEWIGKRSTFHFHLLMLLGRQLAYSSGPSKSDTYYQWYKFQVADMNYKLKSKDDFQYAVKTLINTVPLECDLDLLKIHINTAIPAPPYCKIYVTEFKEASKRKVSELNPVIGDPPSVDLKCNSDIIIID